MLQLSHGHWSIENRLHWVRDVTFDEDRCRVRKGAGAQVIASLRNLAISLLRMARARCIAPALRAFARLGRRVSRLIGLPLQLWRGRGHETPPVLKDLNHFRAMHGPDGAMLANRLTARAIFSLSV